MFPAVDVHLFTIQDNAALTVEVLCFSAQFQLSQRKLQHRELIHMLPMESSYSLSWRVPESNLDAPQVRLSYISLVPGDDSQAQH